MVETTKTMQMAETKSAPKKRSKGRIAKKDWKVVQNKINIQLTKGESIGDVPDHIIPSLVAEGVIDK